MQTCCFCAALSVVALAVVLQCLMFFDPTDSLTVRFAFSNSSTTRFSAVCRSCRTVQVRVRSLDDDVALSAVIDMRASVRDVGFSYGAVSLAGLHCGTLYRWTAVTQKEPKQPLDLIESRVSGTAQTPICGSGKITIGFSTPLGGALTRLLVQGLARVC